MLYLRQTIHIPLLDGRYRIVYLNKQSNLAILIDLDETESDTEEWELDFLESYQKDGELEEIEDPYKQLQFLSDDDIKSDLDKAMRDLWWGLLEEAIYNDYHQLLNRKTRRIILSQIRKKANAVGNTFVERTYNRKILQLLKRGLFPNALLGDYRNSGGPGKRRCSTAKNDETSRKRGAPNANAIVSGEDHGLNTSDEIRRDIKLAGDLYEVGEGFPQTVAYKQMLIDFHFIEEKDADDIVQKKKPAPGNIPTLRQYRYWRSIDENPIETSIGRFGKSNHQKNKRDLTRRSEQDVHGPGYLYQVDATIADIYLVRFRDRQTIIGKPVLYFVVDAFSGLIAGFAVTWEGPSWLGARLALENAFSDKVAFCKYYGIHIQPHQWPTHGTCTALKADNSEFASYNSDNVTNLGIRMSNDPRRRPDLKGLVEGRFPLLYDEQISWLAGAVNVDREPGVGKDYVLDSQHTLYEFIGEMIRFILRFNNSKPATDNIFGKMMANDGSLPSRNEIWHWGCANYGRFTTPIDQDLLTANLLPQAKASVTGRGIYFDQRHYTCKTAEDEKWFEYVRSIKKGKKKSRQITIAYHPGSVNHIYWKNHESTKYEVCTLLPRDQEYWNMSQDEVKDHRILINAGKETALLNEVEHLAEDQTVREQMAQTAKQETREARRGLSKSQIKSGIRDSRNEEKASTRAEDAHRVHDIISGKPTQSESTIQEPGNSPEPQERNNSGRAKFKKLPSKTSKIDKAMEDHFNMIKESDDSEDNEAP